MPNSVRFGVVGLGMGMGRAEICTRTDGAELVAVCDIWEERARAAVAKFDCEWIPDYEQMLARKDIDAIGIWSPSGMHASMAIKALQAGKHAFMTKPMDINTSICDQAIKEAESRDLVLAVDFDSRYRPINHRIKSALSSGAIGDPVLVDLRMKWYRSQTYYNSGKPEAWRSKLSTEGGSMANQAVHYIDLLQWWLGPVKRVIGKKGTFNHAIDTEDASVALIELASGAYGSLMTTTSSFPDIGTALAVTGKTGTLSWQDQGIELFKAARSVGAGDPKKAAYDASFAVEAEAVDLNIEDFGAPDDLPDGIFDDMVHAIRDGKPVQCDGHEGRKSVAIFEAVYETSDTGSWLDI